MAEVTIHIRDNTTGGVGSVVFSRQCKKDKPLTLAQNIGIECVKLIVDMTEVPKKKKKGK